MQQATYSISFRHDMHAIHLYLQQILCLPVHVQGMGSKNQLRQAALLALP